MVRPGEEVGPQSGPREVKYKTKMLGNIRLVGQLIRHGMSQTRKSFLWAGTAEVSEVFRGSFCSGTYCQTRIFSGPLAQELTENLSNFLVEERDLFRFTNVHRGSQLFMDTPRCR